MARRWRTRDFIVAAALAVPLGIVWATGWGLLFRTARGALPELGLFLAGFYMVGGVLVAYIIRRPGAALLGEILAALFEMPFLTSGFVVLWIAFLQSIGVEALFVATRYRRFDLPILLVAGALGALGLFAANYVSQAWFLLSPVLQLVRLVVMLAGGALFSGVAGKLIGDALLQTGVLDNFPIAEARRQEI
jgi:energy-coupling factor transport system substrate-specific component